VFTEIKTKSCFYPPATIPLTIDAMLYDPIPRKIDKSALSDQLRRRLLFVGFATLATCFFVTLVKKAVTAEGAGAPLHFVPRNPAGLEKSSGISLQRPIVALS
jgi:hypothetical protein